MATPDEQLACASGGLFIVSTNDEKWLQSEDPQIVAVELKMQQDELRRAWADLRSSRAAFREVFDTAPIGILLLDAEGNIAHANAFGAANLALREGMSMISGVTTGHRAALARAIVRAAEDPRFAQTIRVALQSEGDAGRRVFDVQLRGITHAREASADGEALGATPTVLACLQDVTDRAKAQVMLERRLNELHGVLDAAPDASCILDGERIRFANVRLCSLLKASRQELVGADLENLFTPSNLAALRALMSSEDGASRAELLLDEGQCLEATVASVQYMEQSCTMVSFRDISERRLLESRAAHIERVAAIGMLVAGVAHEVNNPLAHILLETGSAIEAGEAPNLETVEDIEESALRIRDVVRDLRDYYRQDPDESERVDLNGIVARALRLTEPTIRHRARIKTDLGTLPATALESRRLHQIIVNLLVNASQAMPEGRATKDNLIVVRSYVRDGRFVVSVTDNGTGIRDDDIAHIFDPFFTRKVRGEGTGLGLAISRDLARQLGGDIRVKSSFGEGSTFYLEIPSGGALLSVQRASTPSSETKISTAYRVLIVDDEPGVRNALNRMLAKDAECVQCASAIEAISVLEAGEGFDVILCDVVMGDCSGVELADWIKSQQPSEWKKLFFMTGLADTPKELPPDVPVIHKPFDPRTLRRRIAAAVASRAKPEPRDPVLPTLNDGSDSSN